MKENKEKKKIILLAVGILVLVGLVVGVTYAAFTYSQSGAQLNQITTGTITMIYTEGSDRINITNAMPMSDEAGKLLQNTQELNDQVFDFTVEIRITGNQAVEYEVAAEKYMFELVNGEEVAIPVASQLADSDVKLYLEKSTDGTTYTQVANPANYTPLAANDTVGAKAGEMVLDSDTVSTSVKYYYRLRMWVDEDTSLGNEAKKYSVRVNVYGKDATFETVSASQVGYSDSTSVADELDSLREIIAE